MSTCASCKHWGDGFPGSLEFPHQCPVLTELALVDITVHGDAWTEVDSIDTPHDFGCNKWEAK